VASPQATSPMARPHARPRKHPVVLPRRPTDGGAAARFTRHLSRVEMSLVLRSLTTSINFAATTKDGVTPGMLADAVSTLGDVPNNLTAVLEVLYTR
jgi:hypothetical protein